MVIDTNMNIVERNLSSLNLADYNPRDISSNNLQALENSLKKFGLVEPIIVNKRTNNIVGGNQRVKILIDNDITVAKVIEVDLSEADEKSLNIALNNQGMQGTFNDTVLDLLNQIKAENVDVYDSLRMFEIEKQFNEPTHEFMEDNCPDLDIQPFENYDYVVIMADNVQDWYWLQEKLKLEKVNASAVGGVKIGIGRGIKASKFREILDNGL